MSTIVVTGGTTGVGAAVLDLLKNQGHDLWNLDVVAPPSSDGNAFVSCDLSDQNSIDAAAGELPSSIDRLINVAGIAAAKEPAKVVAVNFLGLRHLTEALSQRMPQGGGISCVSSIAGRDWKRRFERIQPLLETRTMAEGISWCRDNAVGYERDPYTFSKRCVTAFTLLWAQTAISKGLQINCISPGGIETQLSPTFRKLMGSDHSDWVDEQTGGSASPKDIAEVLVMLATQPCFWLNGADIPVDRGYTAGMESGWIDFEQSPAMQKIKAKRGTG